MKMFEVPGGFSDESLGAKPPGALVLLWQVSRGCHHIFHNSSSSSAKCAGIDFRIAYAGFELLSLKVIDRQMACILLRLELL